MVISQLSKFSCYPFRFQNNNKNLSAKISFDEINEETRLEKKNQIGDETEKRNR